MRTSSFHKSNLGDFGKNLPCDISGYVHTTIKGWMGANLDALFWDGYTYEQKRDCCREMARGAREAVRAAEKELANWRRNN